MKVKVTYCVCHTKEVEISDEFAPMADSNHICPAEMCNKAIQAVENAMGIPFGNDDGYNSNYIVYVADSTTHEPMLEWW